MLKKWSYFGGHIANMKERLGERVALLKVDRKKEERAHEIINNCLTNHQEHQSNP